MKNSKRNNKILEIYKEEILNILSIVIPITITQVLQSSVGFINNIMATAYKPSDITVISISISIWSPIILFCHGLLFMLIPLIARSKGSKNDKKEINQYISAGYWLSTFISIVFILLLWKIKYFLKFLYHDDKVLIKNVTNYLHFLMWGIPGSLYYQVLKNYCEGLSKIKPATIISFLSLILTTSINYILINGLFGMPAMGCEGCALGGSIMFWFNFILMKILMKYYNYSKNIISFNKIKKPNFNILILIIKLSLPIALSLFFEVTFFSIINLLINSLKTKYLISHQIASNFNSLIFVFPYSIGSSATIRVGYFLGRNSIEKSKVSMICSCLIGFIFSFLILIFIYLTRFDIINLYHNNNNKTIKTTSFLIITSALCLFPDIIQSVGIGVLRAYKDTKSIFYIILFSYWIVSLPIGYFLSITLMKNNEVIGYWISIIIGLLLSSILIIFKIIKKIKKK